MSLSTEELLGELRIHLGDLSLDELSEDEALLLLNRSYWELLDKFPFRAKEVSAKFSTVIGERNYIVPQPFEALRQLSIQDSSSLKWKPLTRDGIFNSEQVRDDTTDSRGFPDSYYREGNKIRLSPIPDNVYSITMKYWTTLTDLSTNPDISLTIPRVCHEIVLYGGVYRGFLRLRDFTAAKEFKIQQVALIESLPPEESKEEEDSHTIGVEVLGRDYP